MSGSLRIGMLLGSFPVVSETFILRQITGLLDLGHDVEIFADERNDPAAPLHEEIARYNLLARTTYIDAPLASIPWEIPVIPLSGKTWIPGGETSVHNTARIVKAIPSLLSSLMVTPSLTWKSLQPSEYRYQATSLSALYRLAKLSSFSTKKFDVLHAHFGPVGNSYRFAKRIFNAPLIVTFHGYDFCVTPQNEGSNIYEKLFQTANAVTTNSRYTTEQLERLGCPKTKIHQINVGLNLKEFPFIERSSHPGEPVHILSVGRLVEKKGMEFSLRAVSEARKTFSNIRYDIIGGGPLRESLEKLAEQLGLTEIVTFHGAQDGSFVRKMMAATQIFILPSVTARDGDQEGTPVSLMEAQAAGIPVLSTFHSGIPEVIAHGQSGFLVGERDVAALTERLLFLLKHPETWRELGRVGREHMERNFDIKKLNDDLVALYRWEIEGSA